MYKPEEEIKFVPIAFQPNKVEKKSQLEIRMTPGGQSNFISQAIRAGIEDMRKFPTLEDR